jgi:hypothetical protein
VIVFFVRPNNVLNEAVADDVAPGHFDDAYPIDPRQSLHGVG